MRSHDSAFLAYIAREPHVTGCAFFRGGLSAVFEQPVQWRASHGESCRVWCLWGTLDLNAFMHES